MQLKKPAIECHVYIARTSFFVLSNFDNKIKNAIFKHERERKHRKKREKIQRKKRERERW